MAAKAAPSKKTSKRKASSPSKKPAKPLARLGEALLAPRRGEPLNLVVARAHIVAGGVRLVLETPDVVRSTPGGKLLVKFAYRLQEDSPEREEYRFLLRSRLGNKQHAPSLARFGDVYGVPEDIAGFLVHEYTLPASGSITLEVEVGAEYTVGSWKSVDVDQHEVKQAAATVQILV